MAVNGTVSKTSFSPKKRDQFITKEDYNSIENALNRLNSIRGNVDNCGNCCQSQCSECRQCAVRTGRNGQYLMDYSTYEFLTGIGLKQCKYPLNCRDSYCGCASSK